MMRIWTRVIAGASTVVLAMCCVQCVFAVSTTFGALVVTAPKGIIRDAPGAYHIDLGVIDPLTRAVVERTFTFKNTTKDAVFITELRGSCGCETMLMSQGDRKVATASLAPGAQATVKLSIKMDSYSNGPVRKYVWAYGPGGTSQPLVTIALDMTFARSISFNPPNIDFRSVTAGQTSSVPVTLTVLKRIVTGHDLPTPVSTNPSVMVRALTATAEISENGNQALRRTYSISLASDAPTGSIAGGVRFQSNIVRPGKFPLALTAPVFGIVTGNASATPSTVFFGSLPAHALAARTVILTVPPESHTDLAAKSDEPWLTASIAAGKGIKRVLTIELQKNAPVGNVKATVMVTVGAKHVISIPVIAELTR